MSNITIIGNITQSIYKHRTMIYYSILYKKNFVIRKDKYMRINKYIASSGFCSRRKAEEYISSGKVKLNGEVVYDLATQIDEKNDIVSVKDKNLSLETKKVYVMLNKPEGYVTTASDELSRKNVLDLIDENVRLFPVGRLDMNTRGLIILTNDGEFANKLTHPKNKINKIYIAKVIGNITDDKIKNLKNGVDIDGYITKPAKVDKLSNNNLKITIAEGKNRQIRKMCKTQGLEVISLKRIQIGGLNLEDLKIGTYRYLSEGDIQKIFK